MKRILITGANSYIGVSFENYIKKNYPDEYEVDTVDMIDGTWREKDFSPYDCVFHVAGIAHIKENKDNSDLYFKVNRDVAAETAEKAKGEGVRQFIYLSSMSVYGMDVGSITQDTVPASKSSYGKSKLQAEEKLMKLNCDEFKVAILRPPMVYGYGCKGNYQTLRRLALKIPVFPYVKNARSMIYIDNLSEFVRVITGDESGIFFPQNSDYCNTSDMVRLISKANGKKGIIIHGFGWAVKLMNSVSKLSRKAFGSLTYEKSMSEYKINYEVCSFDESILKTEKQHGE